MRTRKTTICAVRRSKVIQKNSLSCDNLLTRHSSVPVDCVAVKGPNLVQSKVADRD